MPGIITPAAGQLLAALGAAAILVGSVVALRQKRLKMLIAYSTVAQIGYLFLMFPLAAGLSAMQLPNDPAVTGGLLGEAGGMRVAAMPSGLHPEVARGLALHRHGLRPGRPMTTVALAPTGALRIEGGTVAGTDAATLDETSEAEPTDGLLRGARLRPAIARPGILAPLATLVGIVAVAQLSQPMR